MGIPRRGISYRAEVHLVPDGRAIPLITIITVHYSRYGRMAGISVKTIKVIAVHACTRYIGES